MKKKRLDDFPYGKSISKIIRVMKVVSFLLLTGFLQVMAVNVHSQNANIKLSMQDIALSEVIKVLQMQTEFTFFYSPDDIKDVIISKVELENATLEKTLDLCLKGTNLDYEIVYKSVILKKGKESISESPVIPIQQQPQRKEIFGIVKDAKGLPIPGVSVIVKGTTLGIVTDSEGKFVLSVPADAKIMAFSFMGMKTQEIVLGNKTTISVSLQEELFGIDEVVTVGFGTQKKVNLTGAVGAVGGESLVVNPATNLTAALQGRLAGVTVTQRTGEPGQESASILIRGLGTMTTDGTTNNAAPMTIVDGVESQMDAISAYDIESVSVLKDAAASAIYGSRAANGVILITTKRGKAGFSEITYNNTFGWQNPTNLPRKLGSPDYAILYNEGLANEGIAPRYSTDDIAKFKSGVDPFGHSNTNWYKLLLTNNGFNQNHNVSFSGGNDKTTYRASFAYFDQNGLLEKSGRNRYSSRVNVDSKIKEWFKLSINSSITRDDVTAPSSPYNYGTEFFRQAYVFPATIANKNPDGTWNSFSGANPIAWLADGGKKTASNSMFTGNTVAELKLMKGLTLKGIMGADFGLYDSKDHEKQVTYGDGTYQGPTSVTDVISRGITTTLQSLLNYDNQFKKHGVKVLLGASRESYTGSTNSGYRNSQPSPYLDQLDAGSTTGWSNSGNTTESRIGSYFGRVNYDYDGKYLFEANIRRDASSKFASNRRVGWFPSMSAGWRMSQESFMKSVNWIDNLKLRASYGQLGNNRIGDYMYIQRITLGQNYDFGGKSVDGAATTVASNNFITWETTTEMNIGFDADLFHNKLLSISADYYDRYTDKILAYVPVSMVFGLSAPLVNAGAMRNKGFEIQVEHRNRIGDWQYGISVNAAFNKNNVEKYENPSKGDRIDAVGSPWDSYYGYKAIGIYKTDVEAAASPHLIGVDVKAGDLIYKDINKDGVIDGSDRVELGNPIPEITFASNLNLKYKGFDLTAFFQGATNVYRTVSTEAFYPFSPTGAEIRHLDRTIVANGAVVKMGHYPRTVISETANRVQSSFTVMDATYLRLKNLQFGYTLPHSWTQALKIVSKARVYISGQNLMTFTGIPKGYDPEMPAGIYDWSFYYPQVKFYTFGFDITF